MLGPEVINEKYGSKHTTGCKTGSVCIPEGEGTAARIFKDSPKKAAGKLELVESQKTAIIRKGVAAYLQDTLADNPFYSCIVVISDTKSGSYYGTQLLRLYSQILLI